MDSMDAPALPPLPARDRRDYHAALADWHRVASAGVPDMDENGETVLRPHPAYDPFAGYEPLPGLEHLGRAIRDASGMPSDSPANFEQLRGAPHPDGWGAVQEAAVADMEQLLKELQARHGLASEAVTETPPAPEQHEQDLA